MPPKKMFPRGGNVVSKGQKNKKILDKVKKQQGKKDDLFSEKKVFKGMITKELKEKFKDHKKAKAAHIPEVAKQNMNEIPLALDKDELPKFPLCLKPKNITEGSLALVTISKIGEDELEVSFPGGNSGIIQIESKQDLENIYSVGESLLASVLEMNRYKVVMTIDQKVVNKSMTKFLPNTLVQGQISSVEDEGYIIDLGRGEKTKGFWTTDPTTEKCQIGKILAFQIDQILLKGRQLTLSRPDSGLKVDDVPSYDYILPGLVTTFRTVRQTKDGFVGKVLSDFAATLHALQAEEDILDVQNSERELTVKVVMVNHEEKQIVLANCSNSMLSGSGKFEPVDRRGEKITSTVEMANVFGLVLFNSNDNTRSFCPYHSITEHFTQGEDLIGRYPVGTVVEARIIGYCYLEGMNLVSMKESIVAAKYFRYDEFTAGQIVSGKIQEVNEAGWVLVSLAPNLNAIIPKAHQSNTLISNEAAIQKFKPGSDVKCMVLDTSNNRVALTLKSTLMKSKLKKLVDMKDVKVGDISLATIIYTSTSGVLVQFFNNIIARVPNGQLSLEYVPGEKVTSIFEVGQTVRTRIAGLPKKEGHKIEASFILDPKLRVKNEAETGFEIGEEVSLKIESLRKTDIHGSIWKNGTDTNSKGSIGHSDLAISKVVADSILAKYQVGDIISNLIVESNKGKTKLSNISLVKTSIQKDQLRAGLDVVENQLYLGTVKQETDFGFFVQFGTHRGLLPRANIVDRYTKAHSNLYHAGDLVVFKVDQVDSEKKRCILSTKETDIKDLPEWLAYETVFKTKLEETEQALHLYGLNYKFGESIDVEFEDKAACTRDEIENISISNLPKQITAVCIAQDMTQVYEAKQKAHFIGFHSAGVLLFALSSGDQKVEDEKITYINNDIIIYYDTEGCINVIQKRLSNGLLARNLTIKKNQKIATQTVSSFSSNSIKLSMFADEEAERKHWGIMDVSTLKPGQIADGMIVGVKNFGIQISIGHKLIGRCLFKNVTQYFLPAKKSVEICSKYFKKGKLVKVKVEECSSRKKLEFKLIEEYIDVDKEGLFCTINKKAEKRKQPEIKLVETKKKKVVDESPEVKQEPGEPNVKNIFQAADMDIDFGDSLEQEIAKRKAKTPVNNNTEKVRNETTEEIEEKARQAERDFEKAKLPESVSEWERAILASPNNSEIWLRYSAFHIMSGEIEKARVIFDRALKSIHFREDLEKMNVWKARLNLEAMYGDEESLFEQFNEAKRCNDPEKIYQTMIDLQLDQKNYDLAMRVLKEAVRKYPTNITIWAQLGKCQLEKGEDEKARVTMERALQSNKSKDHVMIIQKFARLEFELGDPEKGRTIFEQTLKLYPKRGDIYSVFADILAKFVSIDEAIHILERGYNELVKSRAKNHLVKRIIMMEQRRGDEQSAQEWRNKLE